MILCGGAQEINALSMGSFDGIGAFSTQIEDPKKASKPFDKNRDGLIPSGGAATLVLESYDSAIKRGANIIAEVMGYGFSSNGEHISVPNVDGLVRSIEKAFKTSGVSAEEIDYINAHATSTPVGDSNEAEALAHFFEELKTPVSSTKSMSGHEMWMGGASEIVYSLLMAKNSFIAPNINFEEPDEQSARLNIITKTTKKEINTFLSNSFGFGGTNSTLIIRKFND
jgi:3-oxoacyl-[acyl-carrier-protein] synthase-1